MLTEQQLTDFNQSLSKAKSFDDLMGKNGVIKQIMKQALESMLEAEISEHLGYEKHSVKGNNTGNSRNGLTKKTVNYSEGAVTLDIPRDRNSDFTPIIIPKHCKSIGNIEDKIISMYAKGMTTRDIQSHIEEIYGIQVSPTSISNITDSIIEDIRQWQSRPLKDVYPIVFLDAIYYKIRQDGKVVSKAAYTALAIDVHGYKEMLGIWVGETESARYWLNVLNDIKSRGVKDVFIACVDGLTGFQEAIETVFPKAIVQGCIVHQIRNSIKYVASKDQKQLINDMKPLYNSDNEQQALEHFHAFQEKWQKYPIVINSWKNNWTKLTNMYLFPPEIRKIIYTTNAVEGLHRQFRKVIKSKSQFPNDLAAIKMIFLAHRDIAKKWTMPIPNWALLLSQFSIIFDIRFSAFL